MAIAAHDITLEGFDRPFQLLDFQMELRPNAHGWAKLLLRLTEKPDLLQELLYGSKLTICYDTDAETKASLFCGVLEYAAVKRKNQYYELSIDLKTGSVALDCEAKWKAYQDGVMTYGQVINRVLAETEEAKTIIATESDLPTGGMLIQCNETDWAFTKRLASHLGEAIFPDWLTGSPAFYFGTKLKNDSAEVMVNDYTIEIDRQFYEQGGFLAGLSKRDYIYYRTETEADYAPGTRANIQGHSRQVLYKYGALRGNQIEFIYDWGEVYRVKREDNARLTGTMLSGTVLETIDERVRVALDIDAVGSAVFHPWTPVTGNLFYCMPEVGTRVTLYCGSRLESGAKAMENVRENGFFQFRAENSEQMPVERAYHERFGNHHDRYFASQDGKELSLLPASIGLGPREATPKILVADHSGVVIDDMTLTLQAVENVVFQGDMIRVDTPGQISAIKAGKGPTSTFNIAKDFNVCAVIGSVKGTQKEAMRISRPAVLEGLGNPGAIEKAALASVALGQIGARRNVSRISEAKGNAASVPLQFSDSLDRKMQAMTSVLSKKNLSAAMPHLLGQTAEPAPVRQGRGEPQVVNISHSLERAMQTMAVSSLPMGGKIRTQKGVQNSVLNRKVRGDSRG